MLTLNDALSYVAREQRSATGEGDEFVVAIVRLAQSGRAWFIIAVHETPEGVQVLGYESGCPYSSDRLFRVRADFFDVAARANSDELSIEVLPRPVPLEMIEDVSL